MHTIKARNFNEAYSEAIETVMAAGAKVPSRNGDTLEIHPVMIEIDNPREYLVTAAGRPVNVAFALAEVIWILGGGNEVDLPAYYNSTIGNYSDDGEVFNAAYGYRMREAFDFDQIEDVIKTLKHDPGTRQAVINIWSPKDDRGFNDEGEPHVTADRACNMLAHLMIRDGRLDWLQILRSNDAVWGTPYNWMQWSHIQTYIAQRVGVPVGKYFHVADSFHIYHYHWDEAKKIRRFNLYERLGYGGIPAAHAPMNADKFWLVAGLERTLRLAPPGGVLALDTRFSEVGHYWRCVLTVLEAHKAYKEGRDEECFDMLANLTDMVYGCAQIRFYMNKRWRKLPNITKRFKDHFEMSRAVSPEVVNWMFTS